MRKPLLVVFVILSFSFLAANKYPDTVVFAVNHLDLTQAQKTAGAIAGLQKFGWVVDSKTANPLVGDLKAMHKSRVAVQIGEDAMTIKYLTKEELENYKFYRRLLSIRAATYMDMLDCTSGTYKLNPPRTEHVRQMRAAAFAIARYQWNISEIGESKIVSTLPGRGRLEAKIIDGNLRFDRWDEYDEKYVDQDDDYIQRVQAVYNAQLRSCQ